MKSLRVLAVLLLALTFTIVLTAPAQAYSEKINSNSASQTISQISLGSWITNPNNSHQYCFVTECGNWYEAEEAAAADGAHLVTINDADEQNWLCTTFANKGSAWIGATDQASEGSFVWVTGETWSYTNWFPPYEPTNSGNEDFVGISLDSSDPMNNYWNDSQPNGDVNAIFEKNDGITMPSITSLSTNQATKGDTVTIDGSGFDGATSVTFGGADGAIVSVTDDEITTTVGDGCSGYVLVTSPAGTALIGGFTFYAQLNVWYTDFNNGHQYEFVESSGDWHQQEADAESLGAHLATFDGQVENDWVTSEFQSLFTDYGPAWIGLTDQYIENNNSANTTSTTFVWVTGEPNSYFNWYPGEPNNSGGNENYVEIYDNGEWNDNGVDATGCAIFEIGTDTTPPTVTGFNPTTAGTGDTVTIDGTGFVDGQTSVSFAGQDASSVTFVSSTEIQAVVADGASGYILLSTPDGTALMDGFTYNTSPTASNLTEQAYSGVAETVTLQGSDADGDILSYIIVDQPSNGTLSGDSTSPDWTYTPNTGFTGSDSFTYKVNDGYTDSNVATVAITVDTNSPVSRWKANGNADDSMGINNGTAVGVTYAAGVSGKAFDFDGSGSYVMVPDSRTLDIGSGFSVDCWVKMAALPSENCILVNKWTDSWEDKLLMINSSGQVGFYLFNISSGNFLYSNTVLVPEQWYYIAGTYDGSTIRVYIDGQLDNSASTSGAVSNSQGTLYFGYNPDRTAIGESWVPFNGLMDEIGWYNRPLQDSEIEAAYTTAHGNFWYLDETDSSVAGKIMQNNPATAGSINISDSQPHFWLANTPATGDVIFPSGVWTIALSTDSPDVATVAIGSYDPQNSTNPFTAFNHTAVPSATYDNGVWTIKITCGSGEVPAGQYLALELTDNTSGTIVINMSGGASYLETPLDDPGYPLPELAAGLLLALGLSGLAAWIVVRRRQNNAARIQAE